MKSPKTRHKVPDPILSDYSYGTDMEDLVPFGKTMMKIGIPNDTPSELKYKLLASINANLLGLRSVDLQAKELKRLLPSFDEDKEFDKLYADVQQVKWFAKKIANRVANLKRVTVPEALWLAEACLIRLEASFKAFTFLILNGYYFESYTVLRLALEQVAYALAIHNLDIHSAIKVSPTKSITGLGKMFPQAGRLYGDLSEKAHITFQQTQFFFAWDRPERKILSGQIVMQTRRNAYETLFFAFLVIDLYGLVSEWILKDYLTKFNFWKRSGGQLQMKKIRESRILAKRMMSKQKKWDH